MNITKVNDLSNPALDVYVRLTGAQLRAKKEESEGIFIAESPTVIEVAMQGGCEPVSLLTDERLIASGDVERLLLRHPDIPVYTADRDTLTHLTGFELTRGALCAMRRPKAKSPCEILATAKRVAVLEGICDATNVGAIFRSAAALGIDAVLVTPTTCDPLCRRAVRVSMGTVFLVPFARIGASPADWPRDMDILKAMGFKCAAMALSDNSVSIDDKGLLSEEKIALILGTEGTGLARETIEKSDYTVKIPMSNGVDSLNVGAAAAVAFWQIRKS